MALVFVVRGLLSWSPGNEALFYRFAIPKPKIVFKKYLDKE